MKKQLRRLRSFLIFTICFTLVFNNIGFTNITTPFATIKATFGNKCLLAYNATDALDRATAYEYDGNGNLTAVTDPSGVTVRYEYDALNNQIKEYVPGDGSTSGGNQAGGNQSGTAFTFTTIYQYDKRSQMIKEIDPSGQAKTYAYDGNGNMVKMVDEDGYTTAITYDLNDSPVSLSYSDGKKALLRYNKRGELVELTDWTGTTALAYDRAGRLSQVTDPAGTADRLSL